MIGPHLVYFADPMCSWCWGFSPVIEAVERQFGAALPIRLVLGGLRPGTTHPMDEASRSTMRGHWERVHGASGQPFDFAFFDRERFVYDTEPACRAVVVMRRRGATDALGAFRRIQFAFYAENRDVTCVETLAEIACELGCDEAEFRTAFAEAAAVEETRTDFAITQQAGIDGFPTLLAGKGPAASYALVSQGFQPAIRILPVLERWHAQQDAP
jgi:putative protein-disulfide isomerase